jgi:type VI secretion system secreted protein Hcp
MRGLSVRRLAPPLLAAVATSVVVAAMAVGGTTGTSAGPAGPPTPTGQAAGELTILGKTIPIQSFSIGASNPSTIGSGGGGAGSGKVSFSSLSLIKAVDVTSSALLSAVAKGQHLPTVTFTAQWGTGPSSATMSYKLEEVIVESVSHSGGGNAPTESLSLAFAKVTWTYTDASGTSTGSWNIVTNTE